MPLDNTLAEASAHHCCFHFHVASEIGKTIYLRFSFSLSFFLNACLYIVLIIARSVHNSVLQSIRAECRGCLCFIFVSSILLSLFFSSLSFLLSVIDDESMYFQKNVTVKTLILQISRAYLFIYNKVYVKGIPQRFRLH